MDDDRGGLAQESCRLRPQPIALGGGRGAGPIQQRPNLDEPRAVLGDAQRVGRGSLSERQLQRESQDERAGQEGGNASAASWRSNASFRTRRS